MQVDRLRLVGFKSFVDTAELAIEPGLTGIVGPNGCGKSNLVEAIRWVMAETSARRLRGGEMDDVIFAGAAGRPARNIAEVVLAIDNSARSAPFAFNDRDEIQVVRRIERGGGSVYRVNGREVRARDVQLLFADAATGAHSGALVGQGRVATLIEAKPAERRLLLEEAAGTTGLQARRHETELRLKAAEDNLLRLDDVTATIDGQLQGLKKQARQAQRYRRLGEHIRRTEALLLHSRWLAAAAAAERNDAELRTAEQMVAVCTERALSTQRAREAAETALPPLREAERTAAAELDRLTHARDDLERELQRVLAARREAEQRLSQFAADRQREDALFTEAEAALAKLAAERVAIASADGDATPAQEVATERSREAAVALNDAESVLQNATEAAVAAEARRTALERRQREFAERQARMEARRAEAERQRAALADAAVPTAALTSAAAALADAERRVEECRAGVAAGEEEMSRLVAEEQAASEAERAIEARLTRLRAEADAISTLLAPRPSAGASPPILSSMQVAAGFESAIGAIFEDELTAPLANGEDKPAPSFWLELAPIEGSASLPDGAHPLAENVSAPPALARSLAQAGWVDSEEVGRALQARLAPGQRVVDREGRLWRWDGFTRLGPGPSTAAEHLRHANRHAALIGEIEMVETESSRAGRDAVAAHSARQAAVEADREARSRLHAAETAAAAARAAETELARRAMTTETRLVAIADTIDRLTADLTEAATQADETRRDLAALPDPMLMRTALEEARVAAAAARQRENEARAAIEQLRREAESRRERLSSIDLEERAWRKRGEAATTQRAALLERQEALERELAHLAARPGAIAAESQSLGIDIATASASCRRAGDALALGETRSQEAVESSRLADQQVAEAREQRARLDALRDSANEALTSLALEIRERLDTTPDSLPELAAVAAGDAPADITQTAVRLERLIREREGIGPVNLVAESEAAEAEARLTGLQRERTELTEAIARLRRGIGELDREGRQRLTAAFERVNGHFSTLFSRLFGGGKAHLALVEDDDPLLAGLEIMASPPGKRLQSLSLLSGGEQALTALALIFAVFLTNPAPLCVLDEVDAALDDANVDRFCSLLGEIADATGTRFLVVTHHRITMARVDRLFGVTMAERGVSQLVSVDLARAAQLRQTA